MPPDFTVFDAIAVSWFLFAWMAYTLVQDHLLRGSIGVNQSLRTVRRVWMVRLLERDTRIMDSNLLGQTMHSVTFAASTTMLVLAGLIGVLGTLDTAYGVIQQLAFTVKTSRPLFEMKLLLMVGIFIHSFFKFTWALRQYNYCCALIGSAPLPPLPDDVKQSAAASMAEVLTLAVTSFNGGLRAFYFALAALTWFLQPWLFLVATNWVILVLIRRQIWSRTYKSLRRYVDVL